MLYDIYVDKHIRESSMLSLGSHKMIRIRDLYKIWYPYLGEIDTLVLTPGYLRILYKRDPFLDKVMGPSHTWIWHHDPGYRHYTYLGTNEGIVYDAILIMLRMYHSYSIPHIAYSGIKYYPR
jgi:hypothetical protein